MLDWQEKKWIKVVAIIVVAAFLTYDIAWATDFSPISIPPIGTKSLPKISIPKGDDFISGSAISESALDKTQKIQKDELPEETEISFRSQLIPRKKYGEQSGFLRIESVKKMIKRQMDEMKRRQQIQEDRGRREFRNYNINRRLYMDAVGKAQEAQSVSDQIMKARSNTFDAASAFTEFSYTMNKDGSRVNYKNGLPSSIYNEPAYDSLGQYSLKNTLNMTYSSRRLLVSYDAEIRDSLGNATKIRWFDGVYSGDSIWWAGPNTSAGKYLLGYKEIITDPYGTTTMRDWSTTRDSYGSDRKLSTYSDVIKDATGNIISTSIWSDLTYEGSNLTGYHQEAKDAYGNVTISDWDGEFKNGRMASSHSIDTQINRDGTSSVTDSTLTYKYDKDNNIESAYGFTQVNGEAKDANEQLIYTYAGTNEQFYEAINGQLKILYTVSDSEQVNSDTSTSKTHTRFDYVYDDETNLLIDAKEVSTTEGEDVFGSRYESRNESEYDIIASQPRRVSSETETVSETIFGNSVTTNNHVEYFYDELGDFVGDGAKGYTDTTGIDLFGETFSTHTVNEYELVNGQPKLRYAQTGPGLINPSGELGAILTNIENTLSRLVGAPQIEIEEVAREVGAEVGIDFIANLTMDYVNTIMTWLWRASTNVINCAVNALRNIFNIGGVEVDEKEIARDAILVDILSGVITPENIGGELKLSFYSMMKAAAKQGLVLQGVNVSIDQLRGIDRPVIAHIGGDHYVVITQVSDTKITYIDDGKEIIAYIDDFMYMWEGDILSPIVPGGAGLIDIGTMKEIKGAEGGIEDKDFTEETDEDEQPGDDFLPNPTEYKKFSGYTEGDPEDWTNNSHWKWYFNKDKGYWQQIWVVRFTHKISDDESITYDAEGTKRSRTHKDTSDSSKLNHTWTRKYDELGDEIEYTESWEEEDGDRYSYTYDAKTSEIIAVFIRETVEVLNPETEEVETYSHVEQWNEKTGGFKLWRKGNAKDFENAHIEYATYGKNMEMTGLIIIRPEGTGTESSYFSEEGEYTPNPAGTVTVKDGGQWIHKEIRGDKGITIIEADNNVGPGIDRANYYSTNTEEGTIGYATIVRCSGGVAQSKRFDPYGDSYAIDMISYSHEGLITTTRSLLRRIGGTTLKEEMFVFKGDLNYTDEDGNPITSPWQDGFVGSISSWLQKNILSSSLKNIFSVEFYYDDSGLGVVKKVILTIKGKDGDKDKVIKIDNLFVRSEDADGELRFSRREPGVIEELVDIINMEFELTYIDEDTGEVVTHTISEPVTFIIKLSGYDVLGNPQITIDMKYNSYPNAKPEWIKAETHMEPRFREVKTTYPVTTQYWVWNSGATYGNKNGGGVEGYWGLPKDFWDKPVGGDWQDDEYYWLQFKEWVVYDTNGDGYISGCVEGKWSGGRWISKDMDRDGEIEMKEGYWNGSEWVETSLGLNVISSGGKWEDQTVFRTKTETVPDEPEEVIDKAAYWNWEGHLDDPKEITKTGVITFTIWAHGATGTLYQDMTEVIKMLRDKAISQKNEDKAELEEEKTKPGTDMVDIAEIETKIEELEKAIEKIQADYDSIDKIVSFTQTLSWEKDGDYYKPKLIRTYNNLEVEGGTLELGSYFIQTLKGFKNYGKANAPWGDISNKWMPSGEITGSYNGSISGPSLKFNATIVHHSPLTADPLGVFSDIESAPLIIEVGEDGKITSIIKSTATGEVEQFVPYEVGPGRTRFLRKGKAEGEEIIVEYKGENFLVHMVDAEGVDTTLELTPDDRAFVTTKAAPRHAVGVEKVTYEEAGERTTTIWVDLKNNIRRAFGITLSTAKNIVNRVMEFLKIRMQQLGSGANNFVKQAGGLKKIGDWLRRMGTYVINCASKALYNTLVKMGIRTSIEDLAVETILSDLSSGLIKPGQTPILYSSFYSLHKVAFTKGVDLKLYNVTIDELREIKGPVIAEIGGDHAVVITDVKDDIVYLLESDGKLYGVDIEEFKKEFVGFILSNRGPPEKEEILFESPVIISGTPLPPPEEPFFPPPPPAPVWDEGSRHWTSITATSLDGTYVRTDSWVEYSYNEVGQLINAKGGGTTWGEDLFGNRYITKRTDIYQIIRGEAKVIHSISLTNSENLDGSINTSIGALHYIYDEEGILIDADSDSVISFDKFSLDEGQLDEADLDYIGTWIRDGDFPDYLAFVDTDGDGLNDAVKLSATSISLGEDIFGNPFESVTLNTYRIVGGEAKIKTAVTTTDALTFEGNIVHTTNTVDYEYTDGTEFKEELPYVYLNEDGSIKEAYLDPDTGLIRLGLIKNVDGSSISEGQDIFGNTFTFTTINSYSYDILEGQPKIDFADTTRIDETFLGVNTTTTSRMEYEYGAHSDPDTGREGKGVLIGVSGYADTEGRDIFGSVISTHTDSAYTVEKGQVHIASSVTTSKDGNVDIFSNIVGVSSSVEYHYSTVTGKDSRTAYLATSSTTTNSSSSEDMLGNKQESIQSQEIISDYGLMDFIDPRTNEVGSFWGVVKATEITPMIVKGVDISGNEFTTTTTTTYEAGAKHYGRPVAIQNISETEGLDIFGGPYSSKVITNNIYTLKKDDNDKFAYLIQSATLTSESTKEDMFGNVVETITPQILDYVYDFTVSPE
ncbi:cysteine peptidase family C39 domain-containing protein, partial [Candidatus Omnitrophota bacterium]